ncbi:hypothetical protein F5884DRAFT_787621 [Xylogone sp. PMI_703]|nr:hypothetical protein F5884DRAFT_787621 [Xylogone sp. PMI_703]
MGLVDYASSEEDEDQDKNGGLAVAATNATTTTTLKRKREEQDERENIKKEKDVSSSHLPPLPPRFRDLYATATKLSAGDDPSLHGGRKRTIPHIQGNWPTHLYIEWFPSSAEYSLLNGLISALQAAIPALPLKDDTVSTAIHSFLTSDLGAPLPLHISLSRSLGLLTEQKDAFLSSLQNAIKSSRIRPFDVFFTGLDWVPNFEKTRWFLVLRARRPIADELNKLLHVCNSVAREYGQPLLYTETRSGTSHAAAANVRGEASGSNGRLSKRNGARGKATDYWEDMVDVSDAFHVSIAWTLEKPSEEVIERTKEVQESADFEEVRKATKIKTEEIKAKIGNVVTSIGLPSLRASVNGGLFGI